MSDPVFTNAFKQGLVGTYTNSETDIELDSITNTPGNNDYLADPATEGDYYLCLYDALYGNPADSHNNGSFEIVRVTAVNYTTNVITVTRAQQNTTAQTLGARDWTAFFSATADLWDQKADLEGSTSQTFNVATATANEHATRKEQVALLTGGADANFTAMPQLSGTDIVESETTTLDFSSDANFSAGEMKFHRIKRGDAQIVSAHATTLIEHSSASSVSSASGFLPANFRPTGQIVRNVYVGFATSSLCRIEVATDGTITFDFVDMNDGSAFSRSNVGNGVTITYPI